MKRFGRAPSRLISDNDWGAEKKGRFRARKEARRTETYTYYPRTPSSSIEGWNFFLFFPFFFSLLPSFTDTLVFCPGIQAFDGSGRQSLTEMMVRRADCGSKMISIGDTRFAITIAEYYDRPSFSFLFLFFFINGALRCPRCISLDATSAFCVQRAKMSLLIDPVATRYQTSRSRFFSDDDKKKSLVTGREGILRGRLIENRTAVGSERATSWFSMLTFLWSRSETAAIEVDQAFV